MPQVTGTFECLKNGVMTLCHGKNTPKTTHAIADTATCTINGQGAKVADLQEDDTISLTGDPATSVSATR